MLAARLNLTTHRLGLTEEPVPSPGPGHVRIAVKAAGVCLSDAHLIDGGLIPLCNPFDSVTPGHEVAGVVDEVGVGVPVGCRFGQRVLLRVEERCRQCANCVRELAPCMAVRTRGIDYDGGWAQYALAHYTTLVSIPDELPFEHAVIIPEAVATPWSAITTTGQTGPAEAVGVWGAGTMGTLGVQLLRAIGATPIVVFDPLASARERALRLGAQMAADPADPHLGVRVRELTGGCGLDVAFDFTGSAWARRQAGSVLATDGRMVLVGPVHKALTIANSVPFSRLPQRVLGHHGSEPEQVEQLLELVCQGRLDLAQSVGEILPLVEAEAGVARVRRHCDQPVRVVLRP